jgi:hypothetical protein
VRNPTNLKLDMHQDKAFCWYLTSLWEIGVPLGQKTMAAAANKILAAVHSHDEQPPTVSEHWPNRWLKRHLEFTNQKEKSIEMERQQAMNVEQIRDFFIIYRAAVDKYKIETIDIWNMDETGLHVSIGCRQ